MKDIRQIISKYQLQPHPEGGYYREVYRSEQIVASPVSKENRNSVTHIYFLLVQGEFSRFHRVWHDEIWNFYEGDPLQLIEFDGENIEKTTIGVDHNYVKIIKGGVFQAAQITGLYSLVGCSVAPGFDFKDFSFISDQPDYLETINKNYSDYAYLI